ncbi:type II secretion system F family protein, partial [Candidatus Peregrinibacteria bacterium]|nr:type II secretion system F family protein [Candidatus Peregrinibacteria bacterium]
VLEVVLERLATFAEKTEKLQSRIKSAMVYPTLVVIIAVGVLGFLMTVIVPQFMKIFKDVGANLPGITILLQNISTFILSKWYIILGIIIGLVAIYRSLAKLDKAKYFIDVVKIRLPVFGQLTNKVGIGRFARTLGTLINSGVPILQALQIVKDTAENEVIARAISEVHGSIREGESIAKPLGKCKVFPLFVVNMIDVGEETGSLDQMLLKIADAYDEEVDTMVAALTSLLEPMLIVGMGAMVGFIVVAMFLPLISLMGQLGGG